VKNSIVCRNSLIQTYRPSYFVKSYVTLSKVHAKPGSINGKTVVKVSKLTVQNFNVEMFVFKFSDCRRSPLLAPGFANELKLVHNEVMLFKNDVHAGAWCSCLCLHEEFASSNN